VEWKKHPALLPEIINCGRRYLPIWNSILHICSHVVAMLGLPHVPKTGAAAFLWFPGRDGNVQWWVKL
jgi:hypothetical protein